MEVLELLTRGRTDVAVLDTHLPGVDGLELLTHLQTHYSYTSVIITTSHSFLRSRILECDLFKKVGCLAKPYDLLELAQLVQARLSVRPESFIRGVPTFDLLQMMQVSRKSCELQVRSGGSTGYLQLIDGNLVYASCEGLSGVEAVERMLRLDDPEVVTYSGVRHKGDGNIRMPLQELLIICCKNLDEQEAHLASL